MDSADQTRWRRAKDLFHAALDTPPDERNAFVVMAYLAVEPLYDAVRSDARFQTLLRAVGLP